MVLRLLVAIASVPLLCAGFGAAKTPSQTPPVLTYCNPLDLPYRFQLDAPSRRESADPTMVVFENQYWLFPSKSGGYWHSSNLLRWEFIPGSGYPVEEYAPSVVVVGKKLYLTANQTSQLFSTDDPMSGRWYPVADMGRSFGDPALFLDDDGRLYMYSGLSNKDPLTVTELDAKNGFKPGQTVAVEAARAPEHRGWEQRGDSNHLPDQPWIEGSWMTRHENKYYLQFAAPGTEFKSYGDGVLTSDHPTGPFVYAPYSPFSFKPTGFITGAGHGSTFQGIDLRWWHIATMTISVRHMFERRLGLFPTFFLPDGQLVTDTYLGDYPHLLTADRGLAGWMLLSYDKHVTASSELEGHPAINAVDEEVRTWWSARTGAPGEWLEIDLGREKQIYALQINFADEQSTAMGRLEDGYRYLVEASADDKNWTTISDRRSPNHSQDDDSPHRYEPLQTPIPARYVRLTNTHMPAGALFSISGFRVFGKASGKPPGRVNDVKAARDQRDPRHAHVEWKGVKDADFYIVRFGLAPDRLFENYQVYKTNKLEIPSLNAGIRYYLEVDAVNESGITTAKHGIWIP